jgi:hypothetical protein
VVTWPLRWALSSGGREPATRPPSPRSRTFSELIRSIPSAAEISPRRDASYSADSACEFVTSDDDLARAVSGLVETATIEELRTA